MQMNLKISVTIIVQYNLQCISAENIILDTEYPNDIVNIKRIKTEQLKTSVSLLHTVQIALSTSSKLF